jgi:hypothetical protein
MTKQTEIDPIEVLQAISDSIATHLKTLKAGEKATNKKKAKNKSQGDKLDKQTLLEAIIVFKEIFLGYGFHLRQHQGRNVFGESILTTNRNMAFILNRMGYSKEAIEKASPKS